MIFLLWLSFAFAQVPDGYSQLVANEVAGINNHENLLKNPSWEKNTANWTASGGTYARTTTAGQFSRGKAGFSWDSNAAGQTLRSVISSIPAGHVGNEVCAVQLKCSSGTCTHLLEVLDGANVVASQTVNSSTTEFLWTTVNFPITASTTSITCGLKSVAANEPAIYGDNGFVVPAMSWNLGTVQQASIIGTAIQVGATTCQYNETTSTGTNDYVDLGTGTGCNAWSVSGSVSAVGTNDHRITITNMPPGQYEFRVDALFQAQSSGNCSYRFSDGTNTFGYNAQYINSGIIATGNLNGIFSYDSAATRTFKIQAADDGTGCGLNNDAAGRRVIWTVKRFPTSGEVALRSDIGPSMTGWTSFSPDIYEGANLKNSDFTERTGLWKRNGDTLEYQIYLQANASARSGTGAFKYSVPYTAATGGTRNASYWDDHFIRTNVNTSGIVDTPYLGSLAQSTSIVEVLDYGSGPVSYNNTTLNPASGSMQIRGTYKVEGWLAPSVVVPTLIGSVTSNSSGALRTEFVSFGGATENTTSCTSSPCTIYRQSGSVSSVTRIGTGIYNVNWTSNWSSPPACTIDFLYTPLTARKILPSGTSVVTVSFQSRTDPPEANADGAFHVICVGNR